ncbi:MAG: SNF2-related protein [archaeon]
MLKIDYDPKQKTFIVKLPKNIPEYQKKISKVDGVFVSSDENYWHVPRSKKSMKQLVKEFNRQINSTDRAYKEMMKLKNEGDIMLDFDKKTNKFELYVPFNEHNRQILKYKIGKCYKRKSKGCWSVPNNYWTLINIYKIYGKNKISPTPKAKEVLDDYTKRIAKKINNDLVPKLRAIKDTDLSKIPIDFKFKGEYDLYEHQIKMWWAAKEFLKQDAGFAFFADAGVGKSAPAVNVVEYLLEKGEIENALIITPSSLKYNFEEQFEIHSSLKANVLVSYDKDRRKGKTGRRWRWTDANIPIEEYYDGEVDTLENETNSPIQILNYNCIRKLWKKFKNYDIWVCDEYHYLKNRTSGRSKAMKKLSKHIPKRLAMTATPITKDPLDLFSQIKILDPDIFPNRYQNFRKKVAKTFDMEIGKGSKKRTIKKVYGWKDEGLEWLNNTLYTRAIRYRKEECLDDIKEPQYERIAINLPSKVEKFYKELVKNRVAEIGKMGDADYKFVDAANSLAVVSYARQVANGFVGIKNDQGETEYYTIDTFKVDALVDLLQTFDPKEQIIIWYRHKHLLKLIKEALDKEINKKSSRLYEKSYAVINGEVDDMEKATIQSKFRNNDFDYIIASIDVTEGWQGQTAHIGIWLENHFTFDKREQGEGRIYREGVNKRPVFYDIVSIGTIDLKVLRSIRKGESLSEKVLAENIEDWAPFLQEGD